MTLIVEDGSKVIGANSYASVATVDQYHSSRGNSDWAALSSDAAKEAAILRAMTYLEGLRWAGVRSTKDQALQWPRGWVEDRDGYPISASVVPPQVVAALCELALREAKSAGSTLPDLTRGEVLDSIRIEGAIDLKFSHSAPIVPDFPAVKRILDGLIESSGGTMLVR